MSESKPTEDDINKLFVARELREYAAENLNGDDDIDVHKHAALVKNPKIEGALALLYESYEPRTDSMPEDFWSLEFVREILKKHGTKTARKALDERNIAVLDYIVGLTNYDTDASTFEFLQVVEDLFKPDDRHHMLNMIVVAPEPPKGPTGAGKSYTVYSYLEGLEILEPNIKIATNNDTDPYTTRQKWSNLKSWIRDEDGQKVFVWDEAKQTLMYSDQSAGKIVSKMIALLRKHNCHLILIAHTGAGIPKDIRRQVMVTKKTSQTSAEVGAGLEEDKNTGWYQVSDIHYTIKNIPETSVEYDDLRDEGIFEFDADTGESTDSDEVDTVVDEVDTQKHIAVIDYLQSDDGLRAVADRHGTTHETLRTWVNEYTSEE